jgi:pyrroloquinoline quinone (PQQ) biosynthesis protein C
MHNSDGSQGLIAHVKRLANEHFLTPEIQDFLNTTFTHERFRCFLIHNINFIKHRRDCWALAMGEAPLDVKREIWLHEQDELIADPRAGGLDHYTMILEEAALFGVTRSDVETAELHPFVTAALEAWLHLGKKNWLESFTTTAVGEMVNSDAVISGGGYSHRIRQKLVSELGIRKEKLKNENVHIEADQEHVAIFDKVIPAYIKSDADAALVLEAAQKALIIMRAFRGGMAAAMRQCTASLSPL